MAVLSVSLFGRLSVHREGEARTGAMSQKAQELLVYLLLHRRAHPREKLATLLWQHGTTERTKAYLRKALWQLRQSLDIDDSDEIIRVDGEWIRVDPEAALQVDVIAFEEAFDAVRDRKAADMTAEQVEALREAASLYTGDLLESWYREWCLRERERLKDVLLRMLDRLARRCEQEEAYDTGIQYGLWALRVDPARERIHRQLMRLRARAGDRTGALRQYERCAEVLGRELNVRPASATRRLHERIQEDHFPAPPPHEAAAVPEVLVSEGSSEPRGDGGEGAVPSTALQPSRAVSLRDGLERLRQLQSRLAAVQKQLRREVKAVELVLEQRS